MDDSEIEILSHELPFAILRDEELLHEINNPVSFLLEKFLDL